MASIDQHSFSIPTQSIWGNHQYVEHVTSEVSSLTEGTIVVLTVLLPYTCRISVLAIICHHS